MSSVSSVSGRHHRLRHRLLRPLSETTEGPTRVPASPRMDTLAQLRAHLQTAIELEHSTIPVYLCALYSMDSQVNIFAYQTIQSVVMEEMLHMVQAANILNAVGGSPSIDHPDFIPAYPTALPHSDGSFTVSLEKFSQHAIDIFLRIEHPAPASAPPQLDRYDTIGQFYAALREALVRLDTVTPGGIFTGDPARQISADQYYGAGGRLVAVHGLADALLGIDEIVGQGEGIDGTLLDPNHVLFGQDIEYAHFFRFNEIRHGRRYRPGDRPDAAPTGPEVEVRWDAVADMAPNPKLATYPVGSPLWQQTMAFNQAYTRLLHQLHVACNGRPDTLSEAVPMMYQLKYLAQALLRTPNGHGRMAGPSFEYAPSWSNP